MSKKRIRIKMVNQDVPFKKYKEAEKGKREEKESATNKIFGVSVFACTVSFPT
ncbi:MAG: hypothetical protein QW728_02350 [Thermoplasmata archaeon]